jgi:glyoxylase-like metal-dependent hydrolase (beta-lactamase superfamily II)
VVNDDELLYFLAGDTSYDQSLLQKRFLDGVTSDEAATMATMGRIVELADRRPLVYLPSHDVESVARLRDRSILREAAHDRVREPHPH